MKKLLITALMLGTAIVAVPSTEAKAATNTAITAEPQINVRIGPQRGRRNRRTRTVTNTRITRTRFGTFREVVRTTYYANGRTETRVVSRTRVRR